MSEKVLAAMSGGVDSSAAALLLKEQGYECIGATMRLFGGSEAEAECAAAVCGKLGMEHRVFDLSELFSRKVIGSFISEYELGRTPNPCIVCNRYLKFGALLEKAGELGCGLIATGHYARIERDEETGRFKLRKAAFLPKDQSYVLCRLTQEQLSRAIFPLGGLSKEQVREKAAENGFENAHKHDSQDICFIPDGDYAGFIRRATGKNYPEGDFIDTSGKILGRHKGLVCYTIGQRKGLGISLGERAYVCAIDPAANTVTLGQDSDLYTRSVRVRSLNFISVPDITDGLRACVKLRYSHREQPALISRTGEDELTVLFDEPQRAPTPGQSAVIYDGEYVLGGGVIL